MNEHKFYKTYDRSDKLKMFMAKHKIPRVVFWSRFGWTFGFNRDIYAVIGKGIKPVCKNPQNPTIEEINKTHQAYIKEI